MSEKSATPILVAGAVGTVVLLGIAWVFASNVGQQARIDAEEYAAAKASITPATALEVAIKSEEPTMEVAAAEREVAPKVVETPEVEDIVVVPADDSVAAVTETAASTTATTVTAAQTANIEGDVEAGAKVFRKCKACHKIGEGAKNSVGPNLTGIVGRVQGSFDGYEYSDALKALMAEGGEWTPAKLEAFLTKPKAYIPDTKMAFNGLRKEKDRANVIAYLASESE